MHYPPGHPTGNSYSETHFRCANEDCGEFDYRVEVKVVYERETGAAYLDPEDADMCGECGHRMEEED